MSAQHRADLADRSADAGLRDHYRFSQGLRRADQHSTCRHFVELCRRANLLDSTSVSIEGSKFKAVNGREKNFTRAKMQWRMGEIDKSVARYLSQLESADRREAAGGAPMPQVKVTRLKEKIDILRQETDRLKIVETQMLASDDKQISLTDPDARSMTTSGVEGLCPDGAQAQVAVIRALLVITSKARSTPNTILSSPMR